METQQRDSRPPFASRPVPVWLRAVSASALVLGVALAGLLAWGRPRMELTSVVAETHVWLEWAEVAGWCITAGLAAFAAARMRRVGGLMLALWLGVVSVLAAVREMDLHVLLNPGNIHLLGLEPEQAVRFRLDWWTDAATPVGLRLAWAVALLSVAAAVILPFALARFDWPRRLLRLDGFAVPVALGFVVLAVGYGMDDLLGRPLSRAGVNIGLAEELVEMLGQCLLLGGVAVLVWRGVRFGDAEPAAA